MVNELVRPIKVSELAIALKLDWYGLDLDVKYISTLDSIQNSALSFSKTTIEIDLGKQALLIAPPGSNAGNGSIIATKNPRLDFARALILLDKLVGFRELQEEPKFAHAAFISPTAVIGKGVVIGARSFIGHNVVINDGVYIGEDCIIKSNSVIGESGFGFERDEIGRPIRLLHLGSVIIGNRVELGSLNSVCRGTIQNTIIDDDVKTDDHVHIAHNCRIGRGSLITACVEISGGVDVGEYSWIGPNSSIIQKVKIGNKSFIGIASNVTKSVDDGMSVAGNPAKKLLNKKIK
jgi:UDP-3-O-[3-hydroxymyristoyl] glucosamine N-acyltransferase